jgi:hypothetical protein
MSSSIQDQLEIQQLLARYTHAADIHPPETMREIFAADGRFHIEAMGIDLHGIDNIIGFFTEMRPSMEGVYHVNSNLVVDIDGHTATAVSYLTTLRSGAQPELAGIARYEDELVKTDQGWRIQSRGVDM